FDDSDRVVGAVAQDVVGTLLPAALRLATDEDHATIGEGPLLVDCVGRAFPTCRLQAGNNEFSTGVRFSIHLVSPRGRPARLVRGASDLSPDFQALTFCAFHRSAGLASIEARTFSGTSREDTSISPRSSTPSR